MKKTILIIAGIAVLGACSSTPAQAHPQGGQWVLNPYKCPDLVEDRRQRQAARYDEAYDRGPRDVYEDRIERRNMRRDEAVTHCPASAWEWRGPRYRVHYHAPRPVAVNIYYQPHKHRYYRHHGNKKIVINF
ncbi:MAG TPA: hypothetical protein ENJ46_03970 [Hellea balneolensis]|uniref:Lipoprotein n=1 Tax=Hellea balneolensis TaxID=287478 RepID=A0A7C3CBN4_9PROT|nr:hypothetical protein [Hellea balneolensis]